MDATGSQVAAITQKISALVADDHDYTRSWLAEQLQAHPGISEVHQAATAEEAVNKTLSIKAGLVFMDIMFDEPVRRNSRGGSTQESVLDGLAAAQKIWERLGETKIIIVTSQGADSFVKRVFETTPGTASFGYILKDKLARVFEEALDAVLAGDCWIDPAVRRIHDRQQKSGFELPDNLYEVLMCIALGLSDQTSSKLLYIVEQSVQFRLRKLYSHFGIPPKGDPKAGIYNSRCRSVHLALERGLITDSDLKLWAGRLQRRANDMELEIKI
jgi:DNA-binding NarL/FixJ family response regulator